MLANNFSTCTCFAIFELIKFMCFGSRLSTRTKNFSTRARLAPAASSTRTRTQSSAGARNPRGLTRPAQDSSVHISNHAQGRPKIFQVASIFC